MAPSKEQRLSGHCPAGFWMDQFRRETKELNVSSSLTLFETGSGWYDVVVDGSVLQCPLSNSLIFKDNIDDEVFSSFDCKYSRTFRFYWLI
jgi:hypothetical protein